MSTPGKGAPFQNAMRSTAFLLLALTACLASMAFAYFLVRASARSSGASPPSPKAIEHGRALRAWSNELVELTNDFLARAPTVPIGAGARNWVDGRFFSRALQLRHRIAETTKNTLPPRDALLHAADRLGSLARHPEDVLLRRAVLADVWRAAERTEAYIAEQGLAPFLRMPRELPAFAPEAQPGTTVEQRPSAP